MSLPTCRNLGVTISTCSACSRKFATQCSDDDDDDVTTLCRNCRPSAENELESISPAQHQTLQLTPASVTVVASDVSTVACYPTVTTQIPILSSTPLKAKPNQRRRRSQLPPLNCKICGFCFIYRRCLLRHLRETHTGLDTTNLQQYIEMGKSSSVYTIKEDDVSQVSQTSSLNVTVGSEIPSSISLDGASMETHPQEGASASVLHEDGSSSILEENLLGQAAGINPTSPTSAMKLESLAGKDRSVDSVEKRVERTYVCVVCSKGFDRPYRLQRHMYIHNPNRPHVVCQICDRHFTRMDTLDNHMKSVHSDERPFSCTTEGCLKTFATQSALFHHLKTHMNGKPYKCLECEASFALLNEYKQHMRENHADTRDLRCSDCYKLFPTNASLQEHKLVEHRLECEVCGRSFARLAYLQAHIEVHNGDKLYNCKHCSSGFDTEYAYKQHIKVHPEQHRTKKLYQCQLCDKTFHHSSNLVTHYRSPEHRDKANELGLNSGSILPTIDGDLSADMSALVDEVTMGTGEGDNIMQTIAESEAFQATAAVASVSSTSSTGFVTSTATSEPSIVGFESSSGPHILSNESPMPS